MRALQGTLPVALGVALAALLARFAVVLLARPFVGWPAGLRLLVAFIPSAFAIASVVMLIVLSFALARRLRYPVAVGLAVSAFAFVMALPREALGDRASLAHTLGISGIFTAIVIALAAAGAISLGRRRLGAVRGTAAGAAGVVAASGALFALHLSPASGLAGALAPLATLGDSFVALLTITALEAALWLVGIHGPALLAAIVVPVYLQLQGDNIAALGHHAPIPHIVVVTTFLFVFPGGAGATLPLVLLLLRSRVARLRTFAYATLVPSLFNVNEPVIFGLPLAYNPVLAVPFVVAPVALASTTFAAIALGLVARPVVYMPYWVPSLVSAFVTTLDWRACVLVACNVVLAGAIWLPFVRVYERAEAARAVRA